MGKGSFGLRSKHGNGLWLQLRHALEKITCGLQPNKGSVRTTPRRSVISTFAILNRHASPFAFKPLRIAYASKNKFRLARDRQNIQRYFNPLCFEMLAFPLSKCSKPA